jgi:signal peptidase I
MKEESTIEPQNQIKKTVIVKVDNGFWHSIGELIKTLLYMAVIAFTVRAFVLQPFKVEGLSMFPNLHDRDYLLVDKLSYRLSEPRRGDVVVFHYPKNPSVTYVKRVIGLPGETVRIQDSKVYIVNGQFPEGALLTESYIPDENTTLAKASTANAEFDVPQNSFFVLGDNRMNSFDSRGWGELPRSQIIGRVLILTYPLNRISVSHHVGFGF